MPMGNDTNDVIFAKKSMARRKNAKRAMKARRAKLSGGDKPLRLDRLNAVPPLMPRRIAFVLRPALQMLAPVDEQT